MTEQLVFVYGTLKRGRGPMADYLEANAEYLNECMIPGLLYDLGAYPGYKSKGDHIIHGEVFRVTDQGVLDRLDRYEGVRQDSEGNHVGWYKPLYKNAMAKDRNYVYFNVLVYEYLGDVRKREPMPEGIWPNK